MRHSGRDSCSCSASGSGLCSACRLKTPVRLLPRCLPPTDLVTFALLAPAPGNPEVKASKDEGWPPMQAAVAYETMRGNTHAIADAIRAGIKAVFDITIVPSDIR